MAEDFYVRHLKNAEIADLAYAWREACGVPAKQRAVNIVALVEIVLPKLIPNYALSVEETQVLDNVEAYTEFDPLRIAVRENVYFSAIEGDRRARFTFAHEFGHLVLHDTAIPLNRAPEHYKNLEKLPAYASAEKQANKFAAAFLMPEWIVAEHPDAYELSRVCQVSVRSAEIQLARIDRRNIDRLPMAVQRYILGSH